MAMEQKARKYIQTDKKMVSNAKFKSLFVLLSALKIKIHLPDVDDSKQYRWLLQRYTSLRSPALTSQGVLHRG